MHSEEVNSTIAHTNVAAEGSSCAVRRTAEEHAAQTADSDQRMSEL